MNIYVKTAFDGSEALNQYIETRLLTALRPRLREIRDVVLRLSDANGPRGGASDKIARINARVAGSRRIVATATSADIYRSVDGAIDRLKAALGRQLGRRRSRRTSNDARR